MSDKTQGVTGIQWTASVATHTGGFGHMGHHLFEGMARTPSLKIVIALLGDSAGGAGTVGVAEGGIEEIADATLAASDEGLQRAKSDEGLAYCVYLMAQITQAARTTDFLGALNRAGVDVPQIVSVSSESQKPQAEAATEITVFDLVAGFTTAVDKHLQHTRTRNDISELAQLAASESLTALCRLRAETLFGSAMQQALRQLSTPKGFATLTHDFFSRLSRRYLEYYLSRELSNHVGRNRRFASASDHNEFLKQLDTHCRVATGPVRKFAGDWYSKHNFHQDLTLSKAKGFTAHAVDKLRGALRYQEERDAD